MTGEQSVVVTGVSTGIGWGITKVLIANGFTVFGSVRQQSDADRLHRTSRGCLRTSTRAILCLVVWNGGSAYESNTP